MTGAMSIRKISPDGREMCGGEREEHRAWTHDSNDLLLINSSKP